MKKRERQSTFFAEIIVSNNNLEQVEMEESTSGLFDDLSRKKNSHKKSSGRPKQIDRNEPQSH